MVAVAPNRSLSSGNSPLLLQQGPDNPPDFQSAPWSF